MNNPDRLLLNETIHGQRDLIGWGMVIGINDGGASQTVNVRTGVGVERGDIPVVQSYGFASRPPLNGAQAVVAQLGADPADCVVLGIVNSGARFGGLAPGEAVMYGADGTRVALRAGGGIEIKGAGPIHLTGAGTVTIEAAGGLSIVGDASFDGDVSITGTLTVSGALSAGGGLTVSGGATVNGDLHVNGDVHYSGTIGH